MEHRKAERQKEAAGHLGKKERLAKRGATARRAAEGSTRRQVQEGMHQEATRWKEESNEVKSATEGTHPKLKHLEGEELENQRKSMRHRPSGKSPTKDRTAPCASFRIKWVI